MEHITKNINNVNATDMPQKAVRKSKQRDAILNNLKSRYDHPTAYEIYEDVRKELPNISLGTTYRNLSFLKEQGLIQVVSVGAEEHFDANTENHYHLFCNKCGRFYDLDVNPLTEIESLKINNFGGIINDYKLIFYGLCENCCKVC